MRLFTVLLLFLLLACNSQSDNKALDKQLIEINKTVDESKQLSSFLDWRSKRVNFIIDVQHLRIDSVYIIVDSLARTQYFRDSLPDWYLDIQKSDKKVIDSIRQH